MDTLMDSGRGGDPTVHNHSPSPEAEGSTPTSRHSPDNSPQYECADCSRRYSRPEHLERHVRTHRKGRQYVCQICSKAFARIDICKRHTASHAKDYSSGNVQGEAAGLAGNPQRTWTSRSGRVNKACRACAASRVKCDDRKPCNRCRKKGLTCDTGSATRASDPLALGRYNSTVRGRGGDDQQPVDPQLSFNFDCVSGLAASQGHISEASSDGEEWEMADIQTQGKSGGEAAPDFEQGNGQVTHQAVGAVDLPLPDFIKEIMMEHPENSRNWNEANTAQLFNLCWDKSWDNDNDDFGLPALGNLDELFSFIPIPTMEHFPTSSNSEDISNIRRRVTEIWTESPWQWEPNRLDGVSQEQAHLPLTPEESSSPQLREAGQRAERVISERLSKSSRDRLMAMVLANCKSSAFTAQVASSFPSTQLVDSLVNIGMASQDRYDPTALHHGTLSINELPSELLGSIMAAGAVQTSIPTLRKFGYAVQELLRPALVNVWDHDNSQTRNILFIQAKIIYLEIGLWSCNRRKMELAYAHSQPSITMLREAGHFRGSTYAIVMPSPDDDGEELVEKWRRWAKGESTKRLVWKYFLQEAQKSLGMFMMPLISYAEVTLDLPCPHAAWVARDAQTWKTVMLEYTDESRTSNRSLNLHDIIRDIQLMVSGKPLIDPHLSAFIYLHAIWGMIYEYKKMESILEPKPPSLNVSGPSNVVLSSRRQELRQLLVQFEHVSSEWEYSSCCYRTHILLHLLRLNLHVSQEDIRVFLGKVGDEQARNIYPVLQDWVGSRDARQAVWHTGQIYRIAKMFPRRQLKNFYALIVYQACLVLWVYAVILRAKTSSQPGNSITARSKYVFIDEPESIESKRFIATGMLGARLTGVAAETPRTASLDDPSKCMEIGYEILHTNASAGQEIQGESLPLMVESLCKLIKQLEHAAKAVNIGDI